MQYYPLIIIGGGVSGCLAAISPHNCLPTLIIERNDEILKKFMLTGKGHSNIANTSPPKEFLNNLIDSNKFLYPALHEYDGQHWLKFLESLKVNYYYKAPHRVHLHDTNASVRRKILQQLEQHQITCVYHTTVQHITRQDAHFILHTNNTTYSCDYLIIATGGLSYPNLGCYGDGYRFAHNFNLPVTARYPIGVGIHCQCFDASLQGTSIDDVNVKVVVKGKVVCQETGGFMFTHYGIGGPVIRRVSGYVSKALLSHSPCELHISFVNPQTCTSSISSFHHLSEAFPHLPHKFLTTHLQAWVKQDLCHLKKVEQQALLQQLCNYVISVEVTEDFTYAINTGGGVSLKALNPNTYESTIENLYFIGEVIDLNPRTNGFNITTCYATANKCMAAIAIKSHQQK